MTRGVWSAVSEVDGRKVIIMDAEGCDSSERGSEGQAIERKLALFALVLSDVLIVNLWSNDVGRRSASNMALLRSVIQLQWELFGSDEELRKRPMKLLFLLRDFDAQTPAEKIEGHLRHQVQSIFEEVTLGSSPPESNPSPTIDDLLQQDFVFLPHRTFCSAEFKAVVKVLRQWLFLPDVYCRGVAAADLPHFATSLWDTIRHDEKLNIPSQMNLLALYRCGKTADQVRTATMDTLRKLGTHLGMNSPDLIEDVYSGSKSLTVFECVASVVDDAMLEFNLAVFGHSEQIVEAKANELVKELLPAALEAFQSGVRRTKSRSLERLQHELETITDGPATPWTSFAADAARVKTEVLDEFVRAVRVGEAGERYESWKSVIVSEVDDLGREADVALLVARERVLRFCKLELEREMLAGVLPPLQAMVAKGDLDLWEQATRLCRSKWSELEVRAESMFYGVGIEDAQVQMEAVRERLRLAAVESVRSLIGTSSAFFHRLSATFREALPENWASQANSSVLVADARSYALEKLLLLCVVRIDGLDGMRKPAVVHFTDSERDELMNDLERMETGLLRAARAEEYQRNVRIAEVVLSTATVVSMALATVAFGASRRS